MHMVKPCSEGFAALRMIGALLCRQSCTPEGAAGAEALGVSGTLWNASAISRSVRPFFSRKERLESTGELRTCGQAQTSLQRHMTRSHWRSALLSGVRSLFVQ